MNREIIERILFVGYLYSRKLMTEKDYDKELKSLKLIEQFG